MGDWKNWLQAGSLIFMLAAGAWGLYRSQSLDIEQGRILGASLDIRVTNLERQELADRADMTLMANDFRNSLNKQQDALIDLRLTFAGRKFK
jgi:hypothetical protein